MKVGAYMCTVIAWKNKNLYFGRTMDISYSFNERVVIVPRGYPISFKREKTIYDHYAMIGMACVVDGYPLYADAMNEFGLCMAGLNFKGFAYYQSKEIIDKKNITPYELIPYILGMCKNVEEAIIQLKEISVIAIPFNPMLELAPLHFMISDTNKNIVIEYTKSGLHLYENPFGVMCNNPEFSYHIQNVNNYLYCNEFEAINKLNKNYALSSLGMGSGGLGIPGDTSSPSRFVRAVFLSSKASKDMCSVHQMFHLLDGVKVVKGTSLTKGGIEDYTTYMTCMDTKDKIYYYKTYISDKIMGIALHEKDCQGNELIEYVIKESNLLFVLNKE